MAQHLKELRDEGSDEEEAELPPGALSAAAHDAINRNFCDAAGRLSTAPHVQY